MKFTAIITHANSDQALIHITADDVKTAHRQVRKQVPSDSTVRVYIETQPDGKIDTDGIQSASLMIVKRTTANMIQRESGDLHFILYRECRREPIIDERIHDCLQVVNLALLQAISDGLTIDEQYHSGYIALNKWLRDNKHINLSATAQRTIYINDVNGDIVNITGNIGRILKQGERYTPIEYLNDDPETIEKQLDVINTIASALTPTQLTVLKHLANGKSERQIADDMHRGKTTIHEHITLIRKKANELYPDGYRHIITE